MEQSNIFWEQQNFFVQRIIEKQGARKRRILVRCHELASPQLFPTSNISQYNPLGLETHKSTALPLFLLDLNVLFDAVKTRRRLHENAKKVISG